MEETQQVDASVLVPVLNEEDHIREAVDAMRAQEFDGRIEFLGQRDMRAVAERLGELKPARVECGMHPLQFAGPCTDRDVDYLSDRENLHFGQIDPERLKILEVIFQLFPGVLGRTLQWTRR